MSDTGSEPDARQSEDTSGSPTRTMHWSLAVIPAAAFVIGLVIGGLVTGAGSDGEEPSATETLTVGPSPGESPDTAVVVPTECIEAAETAQQATQLIRDNLSAIQDFQPQRIIDMLNELEDLTKQANDQAESCSDIEVSTSDGASATP